LRARDLDPDDADDPDDPERDRREDEPELELPLLSSSSSSSPPLEPNSDSFAPSRIPLVLLEAPSWVMSSISCGRPSPSELPMSRRLTASANRR
jgi:hypothetical protein